MELRIRRRLEKEIDELTRHRQLSRLKMLFIVRFPQENLENSMYGFIVGAISMKFTQLTNKKLSDIGTGELWDIIEKKTPQIKTKIQQVLIH